MDINNTQNQSYWFVLREDQSNVYNFTIQNPPIQGEGTRYIVDTVDNRQYIQINEGAIAIPEDTAQPYERDDVKTKDEEVFWDRNKIKLFLNLFLDDQYRMAPKDNDLWHKIACIVGASPDECAKKYKNLRKTYIRLLKKKRLGKHIKWIHYSTCEEVFKECNSLPSSALDTWDDSKVKRLLNLYIDNLSKFRDPYCLQKDIWKEIAAELGATEYNCYHKFKNLKRTYFNWLERNHQTGKLIKWPYHNYFERIFYNFKPIIGTWDRNKIKQLMQAYMQNLHKFKNPKFLKKELWKDISAVVGESPSNCDRKFRNLKQTYIRLKMREDMGRTVTKWCYYKDFETIYSTTNCYPGMCSEDNYIQKLLTFYIENKDKFRNRLCKKKHLWKEIGSRLGLSPEECHKKFRNLKQTYIRLKEKTATTGKCCKWPYYSFFENIYDDARTDHDYTHHGDVDHTTLYEVKKALRTMQKRDTDKFDRLVAVAEQSNDIQRERNRILQALLDHRH